VKDAIRRPIKKATTPSPSIVMPTCLIAEGDGFELEDGI